MLNQVKWERYSVVLNIGQVNNSAVVALPDPERRVAAYANVIAGLLRDAMPNLRQVENTVLLMNEGHGTEPTDVLNFDIMSKLAPGGTGEELAKLVNALAKRFGQNCIAYVAYDTAVPGAPTITGLAGPDTGRYQPFDINHFIGAGADQAFAAKLETARVCA